MTVAELLARIMAAYPGATSEAMKTFTPVFYARLRRHEGDALDDAASAVLGTFKSTTRQPFPIPADFEAHLPSGKLNLPAESSDRLAIDERKTRRNRNIQAWMEGQGAKIRDSRHERVYAACLLMAMEHSGRSSWRYLNAEQIKLCDHLALSQERVMRCGPLPDTTEAWWSQISQIAAEWGIATTLEEWASKKRAQQPQAEAA